MKFTPALIACIALAVPALTEAAEAGRPPPRPIEGPPLALAIEAAETAIATCKANGYGVTATIVDQEGAVKLAMAADGAPAPGSNGGRRKAIMAVTFKDSSGAIRDRMKTDPELAARITGDPNNFFPAQGALLIKVGDRIVGAIGVGGAPGGDKDEVCAKAGIDRIQSRLK